jgi:hypothetical protein
LRQSGNAQPGDQAEFAQHSFHGATGGRGFNMGQR